MNVDLVVKNYRCFGEEPPLILELRDDCIAFVGVNNSGKSTLLKLFWEFRNLFHQFHAVPDTFIKGITGGEHLFQATSEVIYSQELFNSANDRPIQLELYFRDLQNRSSNSTLPCLEKIRFIVKRPNANVGWHKNFSWSMQATSNKGRIEGGNYSIRDGVLCREGNPYIDCSALFEFCNDFVDSFYIGPFRNALNLSGSNQYYDIQVGKQFIINWRSSKTGDDHYRRTIAHQVIRDIKRIFNFEEFDIDSSFDDTKLIATINGDSRTIDEIGSGLIQFIIVLASTAIRHPSYILIDEPELNLHPTLQLDFLTTLASYSQKGVLFATHSYGLARASADRIYSVQKPRHRPSIVKPLEATPSLPEFLGELGFSAYRELGFDKVLLVEGSTDIKTMQQFLRMYKKDHEIAIISLGGGDMIKADSKDELHELLRISRRLFAIIDSERPSDHEPPFADRIAFAQSCESLGIECLILDRRATENYLTAFAIKATKGEKYEPLSHYELLKDHQPGWGKAENWRIARSMRPEDLDATDLGAFLRAI